MKRALSKAAASTSSQMPRGEASVAPFVQMGAMEPLLDGRRDRDRRVAEPSNEMSLESTLEFEYEEEGVTVGGSR